MPDSDWEGGPQGSGLHSMGAVTNHDGYMTDGSGAPLYPS